MCVTISKHTSNTTIQPDSHSSSQHGAARLLGEGVLGGLDVVHNHRHAPAHALAAQELARLEHPRDVVQRAEAFGPGGGLAFFVGVVPGGEGGFS